MDLSNEQMERLKAEERKMLKEFIRVCDELGLKYYILGGTLLGAVRHKGFIPWDDDIDVGLPRKDYDVFMEKAQPMLPAHYFVQNILSEDDYRQNFAKIRNSNTAFIETSVRHCKINHGVFIDIFPLDFCPSDEKKRSMLTLKISLCNTRIAMGFRFPGPKARKSFKGRIAAVLTRIINPTIRVAIRRKEKLMRSARDEGMYANYCGVWGNKEYMPAEWYGEGVYLDFDGIKARAPKEYDKYLTQMYGDYMQPPPEDKRISHHYCDVIDIENSYLKYITEKEKAK